MKHIFSLFSKDEKISILAFLFVIITVSILAGMPFDCVDKYMKLMNVISVGVGGFLWGIAASSRRVSAAYKKLEDESKALHIEALIAIGNAKKFKEFYEKQNEQVKEYYANKINKC